jgi:alpha-glucuronidase
VHRFIGKLATVRAARHDNNGEQNIYIVAAADNSHVSYNIFANETTGVVTGPFKALRDIKDGDRVKKMSDKEKKAAEGQGAGTS